MLFNSKDSIYIQLYLTRGFDQCLSVERISYYVSLIWYSKVHVTYVKSAVHNHTVIIF